MLKPLLVNLWAIVATTADEQKHSLIWNPDRSKGEGALGTSFTAPVNDDWEIHVEFRPRVAPCGCKDGQHECF